MSRFRSRPLAAFTALAAGVLGLAVVGTAQPAAADQTCTGTIGAQTIDDDVQVPTGASCMLDGTTVTGNVLVAPGGQLTATGVDVDGNIQDVNGSAGNVAVTGSSVGGSIQLEQGTSSTVSNTSIVGDLQLESNSPAPTGSVNIVQGSAEGQCADLSGSTTTPPPPTDTARPTSRIAGATRYATAVQISQVAFPNGASTVYLANAFEAADALAGKSLTDRPILLVPGCDAVPSTVLAEIGRLDPTRVVALGGPAAVCDQVLATAGNA